MVESSAAPAPGAVVNEQALPAARYGLFLFTATLLIAAFYLYSALFLLIGSLLWVVVLVLGLIGSQYGGMAVGWPVLNGLGAALKACARGLKIGRGAEFHLTLAREQAPRLWEVVEDLSRRLGVAPPREFVLENGVNAYVMLRGVAAGRGKTRLGVGFDLLAGLSEAQARAVMAHEIAHAKYVRRGYQGFLMRGLFRLSRCAGAFEGIAGHEENPKAARNVARMVGAVPIRISKSAGRLIAACSRYDEFLADRVAAEICGPTPCRAALLATHVLDFQADKIDYRERLLHLEREPGYARWLRERLHVPDDAKRLEIEARALARAQRHEMSTHPALPDRLAAIDAVADATGSDEGAATGLVWLRKPDEIAGLLLRHIEQTAAKEEAKATQSLARWMRKRGRERGRNALANNEKLWALAMLGFAVFFGMVWWNFAREMLLPSEDFDPLQSWALIAGVALLPLGSGAAAVYLATKTPQRAGQLPIPAFSFQRAAQLQTRDHNRAARDRVAARKKLPPAEKRALDAADEEAKARRNIERGGALRAAAPAELTRAAALTRFRIDQGYAALARGEMAEAAHCARLILELDGTRAEAVILRAICNAARGWQGVVGNLENAAATKMGAQGQWALAWIACLQGETGTGEAFLLEQSRRHPQSATVRALLAGCQAQNGKPREALASRKLALQLARQTPHTDAQVAHADEACHRFLLAQNQIALGQLSEARDELDWLEIYRTKCDKASASLVGLDVFALELEELKWQVARGETERALARADQLAAAQPRARDQIEIGEALSEAREELPRRAAQVCYERALEIGFYPQAKVALSRLFYDREERECARRALLESLDMSHPRPHDAAHPLSQLNDVTQGLRLIADAPPAPVQGWEIALDAKGLKLDVKTLHLLILAPDEAAARAQGAEIFEALVPDQAFDDRLKITRAPAQYQPDEPAPPGIYGTRWEDE